MRTLARATDPVAIKTKRGSSKDIGGGESEVWNRRQKNAGDVGMAVVSGVLGPADIR